MAGQAVEEGGLNLLLFFLIFIDIVLSSWYNLIVSGFIS